MPTRRLCLSKQQEGEYRARLSRLEDMGLATGSAGDISSEHERFILEQTDHEFARVHDLEAGEVAVVLPAKLTVLKPGVMFTEAQLRPSWIDWEIDLDNIENNEPIINEITQGLRVFPPRILNHEFVGRPVPLRPCQIEGVIIGNGYSAVPPEFHDETIVTMELLLMDERNSVFSYEFRARVDRSVMRKRKYLTSKSSAGSARRSGLYDTIEPDDQVGISREVQVKSARQN